MRFAALNFLFVAGAISLLNGLFPVYARNEARLSEDVIGGLFLLNALVIIAFQLPTARVVEGRRRMRAFALMSTLFAASWLLVAAGGTLLVGAAVVVLAVAILTMSLAECLYDSVQGALVADLARPELIGRYMAVTGFSWQLGFIVGPAVGGFFLGAGPTALWPAAACVCLLGGVYALVLERRLPGHALRTPLTASTAEGTCT
jgi:MFS family permease